MHALLLVPLVGCASRFASDEGPRTPEGAVDTGTSPTTGAVTDSTDAPLTASYYGLELAFAVDAYGGWADGAALDVALYGADTALGAMCSAQVPLEAVVAASDTAPEVVYAWWDLALGEGVVETMTDASCPAWARREWSIGLGPYDARLDPAAFAEGLADAELYGLYVQPDDGGPVYVIGVAGTEAMYAGELGLAVDPPAPGPYLARSLILLDL